MASASVSMIRFDQVGLVAFEMVGNVVAFKVDEDLGIGRAGVGLLAAGQEDPVDRLGDLLRTGSRVTTLGWTIAANQAAR